MGMKDYLRASGWDFLLCLVISIAIGFINCGGFMVSDELHTNPAALGLAAGVPLLLMFGAASSKKTVLPGIGVIAVALVAACLVAHAVSGNENMFTDSEGNPVPFIVVMFATTLVTFLMTRRKWLVRAFVPVAILDMCFVEFMYKQGYWYMLIAALVAIGIMMVYRNYRVNLRDASTDKVSFTAAFGIGGVYALALMGITCLIFFLIIAPLNPPAQELKLFTKYMTYETVEMTGIGNSSNSPSNNTTNKLNDQVDKTDQQPEDNGNQNDGKDENQQLAPLDNPATGALASLADQGMQALRDMFNFLIQNPPLFALFWILVVAVIAAPFVIKKKLRARWFRKTCALPARESIRAFYLFFVKRFKMLKVVKPQELTLTEWAESFSGEFYEFEQNSRRTTFKQITQAYCNATYGHIDPTAEELEGAKAFYNNFYKAFAAKSGWIKYCLRFFRV